MSEACPACRRPIEDVDTAPLLAGESTRSCSVCGKRFSGEEATQSLMQSETVNENRLGNFDLIRLLGKGGFGSVWLAEDRNLGRRVALKLPKITDRDAMLLHEAQIAAKLRHPNIVSIYEVGVNEGQVFIASEYIEGEDLGAFLSRGRPKLTDATRMMMTLARALHEAHEEGVVHRDLKPANIIVNNEGEPFITDFGIAKLISSDETISTDGQVVGTVSYMSPEQARGSSKETDARSDIYALGVMLFEMLTEYRPFRGNARAVMHQKIYDDPPSPRKLVPSLPKDLETICLKCLEREPSRRYPTADMLAAELDRFRQSIPIQARPISRIEKGWRWCRRKPGVAALILALFVSLTAGLVSTSFFWSQAEERAEVAQISLYRTHMLLSSKLWEQGDIVGLRQTLDLSEQSRNGDRRPFEWLYFRKLLEPFKQTANFGDVLSDVAVSRDGSRFAAAGHDGTIRIWEAASGQQLRTLRVPSRITSIAFSPQTDHLASASIDGTIRLWNPIDHDRVAAELRHGVGLQQIAFSNDGKRLVSGDRRGLVMLWNVAEREKIGELESVKAAIQVLRFDQSGHRVAAAAGDGVVHVWDSLTERQEHQLATRSLPLSLVFLDNDETLAVGTYGSQIQYWNVVDGKRTTVSQLNSPVGDLEYLSAIERLAAVTTRGELQLIDGNGSLARSLITHTLTHGILAQAGDGQSLVVGSGDGSVKLVDVPALGGRTVTWSDSHVRDVVFDRASSALVYCTGDGSILGFDMEAGTPFELSPPSNREMLALAIDHNTGLLASCGMSRELLVFRLQDRSSVAVLELPHSGFSTLAFSADGRYLVAGSRSGTLCRFDTRDWSAAARQMHRLDVRVTDLHFAPDNRSLAVSYSDGRLSLIHPENWEETSSTEVEAMPLTLTHCAKGRVLAVGTQTGEIHLFEVESLTARHSIKAHSSRINALAAFPTHDRLVSGGRDRELRIWDVQSGELVTTLTGHARQVFGLAVSPDGRAIASGGLAGDLRWWTTE